MKTIEKQKTHAFGKDVYLLGKRKSGEYIWLEFAKWDCGWYWGFGYIESYTNNQYPEKSKDINSHSHWSGLVGKQEHYDIEKKCFVLGSDYINHLNENPDIQSTVLTEKESWELADLMKSFYTLKDTAGLFHSGNSHLTTTGIDLKNTELENHINKVLLPQIFERVYQILTPNDN
jgi:hypothetical protein